MSEFGLYFHENSKMLMVSSGPHFTFTLILHKHNSIDPISEAGIDLY